MQYGQHLMFLIATSLIARYKHTRLFDILIAYIIFVFSRNFATALHNNYTLIALWKLILSDCGTSGTSNFKGKLLWVDTTY